jgi:hypothetical protein
VENPFLSGGEIFNKKEKTQRYRDSRPDFLRFFYHGREALFHLV